MHAKLLLRSVFKAKFNNISPLAVERDSLFSRCDMCLVPEFTVACDSVPVMLRSILSYRLTKAAQIQFRRLQGFDA